MYELGFRNNNCVGCVKGGVGYWNMIRRHFTERFYEMAVLEREIGATCIKEVYLDELDPERGRIEDEMMGECGFFVRNRLWQYSWVIESNHFIILGQNVQK